MADSSPRTWGWDSALSLALAAVACLIGFGAGVGVTYHQVKQSYWTQGFNDGSIDARYQLMLRFAEVAGPLSVCSPEQQVHEREVISVKADAVFAISRGAGVVAMCRAQ
jgi:hypothetical protein